MPHSPALPPALAAAVDAAVAVARRSPTTRLLVARAAGLLDGPGLSPKVRAEVDRAVAAAARPMEPKRVERALRTAWGRPASEVLDDLDEQPIAVRAGSQVHRAQLDGLPVAVRVQRPGLAAAVRNDLVLLDALRAPLGAAFPALDVPGVLREIREAAQDELDSEHVAAAQRQVGRALRRTEGVRVPAVHGELAGEDVLVCELLPGRTLADGGEPADRGAEARGLIRAHVDAVLRAGLVPTDPRPGHVVLLPDGGVGLLGLGIARPWPADRLRALADGLAALRDPDGARALGRAAERLGILAAEDGRRAHELLRHVLGDLVAGRARLDHATLDEVADRAAGAVRELYALAARGTPAPADVSALRAAGQLVVTLAALGADEDWVLVVLDAIG